jgi:hypothetical protein
MTATQPPLAKETREQMVQRYNDQYAVILLGDRPVVLQEGSGADGGEEIRLLSVAGFHEWRRPDFTYSRSEDGPPRKTFASKTWMDSSERRQYNGLVFDPSRSSPASYFNLWKGWAVEPAPIGTQAKCQLFLDHVAENVCSGDEAMFAWVMGWFAQPFQKPTEKLGTSLVLRGGQGTGKTIVGRIVGSLLGQHYSLVADPRYIVGRFNSHLANCLLLQLDEATWGGDHAAAGKLKDLITGDYQFIEYKGREPVRIRNYVRLFITGNNRWLVPAGVDERRFAVLDMSDAKRQNSAYFQAIEDQMEKGGREALLRYLLDFDLTDVPLRTIPSTMALAEQKVSSLTAEQHWWLDILTRGALPGDTTGEGMTETKALYDDYLVRSQKVGVNRKSWDTQLGIALKGMCPGLEKKRPLVHRVGGGTERVTCYVFPPLAKCRAEFERIIAGDNPWGEDAPATWQEYRSP